MFDAIDIKMFKCFESLLLPLAPMTLLSGPNSSGKSSVLQSLVLLHQTMSEHEWSNRLLLNGRTLRLGSVADVVDQVSGRRSFEISLHGQTSIGWRFSGDRAEMSMAVDSVSINGDVTLHPRSMRFLIPTDQLLKSYNLADALMRANYITAERIGPRDVYHLEDPETARVVGPAGEFAASVLFWGRENKVHPDLCITEQPNTLLRQVEARMRSFFPGCGLEVTQIPGLNSITLGLRTSQETDFHRPNNVGFGLTQLLPIVIAALSSKPDNILLVENPEVHLHPAGQSLIGRFLAEVAAIGVQVIIESHSDHVLNGIRRAVRSDVIPASSVMLHYFRARSEGEPQVTTPVVNSDGSVDYWPAGFFDQLDRDMNFLAGWSD